MNLHTGPCFKIQIDGTLNTCKVGIWQPAQEYLT
jgi:uncharacterized protein (DUF2461 family)